MEQVELATTRRVSGYERRLHEAWVREAGGVRASPRSRCSGLIPAIRLRGTEGRAEPPSNPVRFTLATFHLPLQPGQAPTSSKALDRRISDRASAVVVYR
jgi:hypothetical protein